MKNNDLLSYDNETKDFHFISQENKSILLLNILNDLVDYENKQKEIPLEQFNCVKKHFPENIPNIQPDIFRLSLIKSLYFKISKSFSDKVTEVKMLGYSVLLLDYPCILSIIHLLLQVLSQFIEKPNDDKRILSFLERDYGKAGVKNCKIWSSSLLGYFEDFETVKIIDVKISDKAYDKVINLDYILFFSLFFDYLFPFVLEAKIDLNVERINQIYFINRNPYKMIEKTVVKVGKKYHHCIIANYIVSKIICQSDKMINLKLRISDSYFIESYTVFEKELKESPYSENNHMTMIKPENHLTIEGQMIPLANMEEPVKIEDTFSQIPIDNLPYIAHLLSLSNLLCMCCEFNSLDPLIFRQVNLMLIRNIQIEHLSLNLFPNMKCINLRKILFNENYSRLYCKQIDNSFYKDENLSVSPTEGANSLFWVYPKIDTSIDLISLRTLKREVDDVYVLNYEKIPKYLFPSFHLHLTNLLSILESKLRKLKYLIININPYEEILAYDSFNCAIACFIYNIFRIIHNQVHCLELIALDISVNNEYHLCLYEKLQRKHHFNEFNLTELKVKHLILNMNVISPLVQFDYLPLTYVQVIELRNLSFKDFMSLTESMKRIKGLFKQLTEMKIILELTIDFNCYGVYTFFTECIPHTVEKLTFYVKNQIYMYDLSLIIEALWKTKQSLKEKLHVMLYTSIKEINELPERGKGKSLWKCINSHITTIIPNRFMMYCLPQNQANTIHILKLIESNKMFSNIYAVSHYLKNHSKYKASISHIFYGIIQSIYTFPYLSIKINLI